MTQATWKPFQGEVHGRLSTEEIDSLPENAFAFPRTRKEPMPDAAHVRNAIARFDQIEGVTNEDRDLAFANVKKAAEHFGIKMKETSWHDLGSRVKKAG